MNNSYHGRTPKCKKCGKRCQKYGGIGGYSVHCRPCNEQMGVWRRASYARCKIK